MGGKDATLLLLGLTTYHKPVMGSLCDARSVLFKVFDSFRDWLAIWCVKVRNRIGDLQLTSLDKGSSVLMERTFQSVVLD